MRNVATVSRVSAFLFLGLLSRASGLKVVGSVLRSLARNVARNGAKKARPSAALTSLRNRTEISRYVTLHDTE